MRSSAGLLPFRPAGGVPRVFLGHMGGPFWRGRERAWTVIKGEYDPAAESAREAAMREWVEETGTPVPEGRWVDLGTVVQSNRKQVVAYGIEVAEESAVGFVASSTVETQWPPRSGRMIVFPEIDEARWWDLSEACGLVVAAQVAFLDRIAALDPPG